MGPRADPCCCLTVRLKEMKLGVGRGESYASVQLHGSVSGGPHPMQYYHTGYTLTHPLINAYRKLLAWGKVARA
jgi:hypothetical protein